ncbi:MAG TPA: tetratricopeptide repeat protein [Candidatus Acidoferrales bacterium]|nr:tetratricopeptide repeat protein [Candidatus Acidoferrales bacterium]
MSWKRVLVPTFALLGTLGLLLGPGPFLGARTALAANPAIDKAQNLYDTAKFADAVTSLRAALDSGQITGNDVVTARALLARCLVKSGQRLEAKQAFKTVLRLDPAYTPDAVMVPPDEMDVFKLAQREVTQEQIAAGQRIPASLAFFYGVGSGDNSDLGKAIHQQGGPSKMDNQPMFGGSVRFPVRHELSLDIELSRLRATARDSNGVQYEASAIPLIASLVYPLHSTSTVRLNVFVGGGPMMSTKAFAKVDLFGTKLTIFDEKTGFYLHGGLEGEWLPTPKFAVTARVLGRSASESGFFGDTPSDYFLHGRKVDFTGYGASIGLRAYIGY